MSDSGETRQPATAAASDDTGGTDGAEQAPASAEARADSPAELAARVAELEAENERLRTTLASAERARYRRSALLMGGVGLAALVGGYLFPGVRPVLLALGGTGLFAAVLTYFLTPERFVAASVGEAIYETLADNEAAIIDDLDLRGTPTYVPASGHAAPARLVVPLRDDDSIPDETDRVAPFNTEESPCIILQPTGAPLYEAFADAAAVLPAAPEALGQSVGDALVEQFELVDAVDVDAEAGRVTVGITESVYGPLDRFDHPVVSLVASTLAVELDTPITAEATAADARMEWLVTCRWTPEQSDDTDDTATADQPDEAA